ncbi:MAG: phosphonate ABC transporter, permease protein PhnE [Acidimicrobiia bacterium]
MTSGAPVVDRPQEPRLGRILKWVVTILIVGPFIWGVLGLDISMDRLSSTPGDIWHRVSSLFPPDFDEFGKMVDKMFESIYVAWVGTIIGATLSFPLAFAAAVNVSPRWVSTPVRGFLSAVRAFPELVLAIIFIPAFGLGPFTATLAIGIHSIGTLGKLSSEVIEGTDAGPVEAIRASGGSRLQEMRFGIVPQAMPNILAYWLYRFEINIRASAVLGVIGAGGIGDLLIGRLRFREWEKAGAVLILTIVTVMIIDLISSAVRRRIIAGVPSEGPIARLSKSIIGSPAYHEDHTEGGEIYATDLRPPPVS